MRPVIGVIPLYDEEKDSYWMLPGYMLSLEECGALPIMLPLTDDTEELDELFDKCDGILFTGGHDVNPKVYGCETSDKCGVTCTLRDSMEEYLLNKCIEKDKPALGICRGIQFMNAILGGTLYQDLPTEHPSATEHHMTAPYDRSVHSVEVSEGTLLADIIGAGIHNVNSYHHQAIRDVAKRATVMAVSEDGIVEAIGLNDKRYILGVQWHPEFSYKVDEDSRKIMRSFTDACL